MRIVSINYMVKKGYSSPQQWLQRIAFSAGVLRALATRHAVMAVEQIDYDGVYTDGPVAYHFLRYYRKTPLRPSKLHRYIKELQPDVVLVQGLLFPVQVMHLRRVLGSKVKIYAIHHAEKPMRGVKAWLQQKADACLDACQFAAEALAVQWHTAGIIKDLSKAHIIMEGSSVFAPLEREAARRQMGVAGDTVYLWVGRLEANKDPLTVVKAFLRFAGTRPRVKLYMIYQSEELLADIQALTAGNTAVQLVGRVQHAALAAWYSSADFFVAGSHYEGSGIAACEAMSCGCIPILTAIPSFIEMTGQGSSGLLYPPGSESGLLAQLQRSLLLDKAAERQKVLNRFAEALSFEAIAARIQEALLSLH